MSGNIGLQRFLLIGPLPPPSTGQSVSFDMLQREMKYHGLACRVVDLSRGAEWKSASSNFSRSLQMIRILFSFIKGIMKGYRTVYLTIAQSRSGFIRDAFMIWFATAVGARIIVHLKGGNYHGFYAAQPYWLQAVVRATLRRTEEIIVLGDGLVNMYDFEPRLRNRVAVVPNALPENFEGMHKQLRNEDLRVLFLSNLIESKGYLVLIEALRILRERNVGFHAFFAGDFVKSSDDESDRSPREAKAYFFEQLEKAGLLNSVDYLGPVSGAKKWDLLAKSHVMVLPTRYVNEGQPVSIIEGMAYGCPVISTRFRAIPDLIIEGKTGFFVDYNDSESIADHLQRLAEDAALYEYMSYNSVEHYRNHFTMKAHLKLIIPIIEGSFSQN